MKHDHIISDRKEILWVDFYTCGVKLHKDIPRKMLTELRLAAFANTDNYK